MSTAPQQPARTQALARVPRWLRPVVRWTMSSWPGRILLRTAAAFVRMELFDRAMTLAAQLFTSIFPLLIMAAVFLGREYGDQVADTIDLPESTRRVLDEALDTSGGFSSFGVFGAAIVLISATSLTRAMIRAYGAIWALPRLTTPVLTLVADSALAVTLPWILLARRVPARLLVPGAVVFGLAMLAVRPAGSVYLSHALQVSADRYGTIGLAFTYIGWLYILSFCYLAAAAVGQVLAQDEGHLGRLIRGASATPRTDTPDRAEP